jgi:4-carboxymuconolactone decarboxylase
MSKLKAGALLGIFAILATGPAAQAAELKVMATGAMTDAVREVADNYAKRTGITVEVVREISGTVAKRMRAGETWDLLLATKEVIDALTSEHILDQGRQAILSRTYVGLCVPAGTTAPDISTAEAFKAAVLAARSISYPDPQNGAPSGAYVEAALKSLGILDAVKSRVTYGQRGADVAVAVSRKQAEIGMTLISELYPEKGVVVVGRLPPPYQRPVTYAVAVATTARNSQDAQALLKELQGPAGSAAIARIRGLERVTSAATARDRFPALTQEQMSSDQQRVAEAILSGPRAATSLSGLFNAWLRSPELADRLQRVGEFLRYQSSLPPRLSEFAILITAREWNAQYEWFAHYPLAMKAGLSPKVAADLLAGKRPAHMQPDEALLYDFSIKMHRNKGVVADEMFAAVRALFGEQGLIDLVGINGYYSLAAMTLNAARVGVPPGESLPLPRLSRR